MPIYSIAMHVAADNKEEAKKYINNALDHRISEHTGDHPIHTIIIEDTLPAILQGAKEELLDIVKDKLIDNLDVDSYYQFEDITCIDDARFEVADSNTPIYIDEVEAIYYIHKSDIDHYWEDYLEVPDNYEQVALCNYIEYKLDDYLNDHVEPLVDNFIEWRDEADRTDDEVRQYIDNNI
jgi:hypothetical protein